MQKIIFTLWIMLLPMKSFSNLLLIGKNYTESEIKKLSQREFQQILREANTALLSKTELADTHPLPGKVQTIDNRLIQAGLVIKEIAFISRIRPKFRKESLNYLKLCSKRRDITRELASTCLAHYFQLIDSKDREQFNKEDYPPEVLRQVSWLLNL